jgi:hypothetical protein
MSTNLTAVLQQLLENTKNPKVLGQLMTPDALYVSLNFNNPELKKVMPWAGTHKGPLSPSPRSSPACRASGRHSTSRLLTPLSRVTALPSSALLPTNPTQPGRKSHLLLACWRVSKGTRLLTSSFSRTATALQAHSKQGAPHGSTAIHRERKLRSNAWQLAITATQPLGTLKFGRLDVAAASSAIMTFRHCRLSWHLYGRRINSRSAQRQYPF